MVEWRRTVKRYLVWAEEQDLWVGAARNVHNWAFDARRLAREQEVNDRLS